MIQIIDGFNLQTSTPIDSRIVVANDTERLAITSVYPGLRVWQVDNNTPYFWDTLTNPGTPDWKSELDLVVTGVDGDVTDGVIPKFSSIDPIQIKDSIMVESIDSGVPEITINGNLDVNQDLTFGGELFGNINANNITTGHLNLNRLNVGSAGAGFVLQINSSNEPEFVSLSGISIGSSATSDQVKLSDVANTNYYKFTLREDNTTTLGTSTSNFGLYSYTTDLLLSQSSNSMCILAHGGSKENPPYSFYDTTSTNPYGILGGMYYNYSGDSIDFSIDDVTQLKIKDDGLHIKTSQYNNPDAINTIVFNNINSIGVPIGGIIIWSGDYSDIGTGNLWNFAECDGTSTPPQMEKPDGSMVDVVWSGGGGNLPNLSGRFALGNNEGAGLGQYEVGDTGGSTTITDENLPTHKHDSGNLHIEIPTGSDLNNTSHGAHVHNSIKGRTHKSDAGNGTNVDGSGSSEDPDDFTSPNWEALEQGSGHGHSSSQFDGETGDGEFANTQFLPPYYVVTYIIRLV